MFHYGRECAACHPLRYHTSTDQAHYLKNFKIGTIYSLSGAISKTRNGEWRNGERGTGNGERGTGNL